MKYPGISILCIVLFVSCASEKAWYEEAEKVKVTSNVNHYFAPSETEANYPLDSSLYTRLLDNGSSEFCAMMTAFTMSEVTMQRALPNRCHKQNFHFQHCNAFLLHDTLSLIFKTQNPRRSMASNKIMKVRLLDNEHHTEIIHWGEEQQEVTHIDGSTTIRKAPTSKVISTKLKLNQKSYELGDTIIGELKVVSVQYKGKRRTKVKEETFGKFRAIVGGYDIDCEVKEVLAHSWLK